MADLPTGTVTFLFTDIEGSTRLLHELGGEDYAHALAEHRRVLREAFARHGGVEVDTQGDAFFVAFPTAAGALTAATEGTEALAEGPVRVRAGVHTGTPLLADDGYVGADVHRAARIAAAAHGGQVVVSAATHALSTDGAFRDLGEHRLKDLAAPERLWQLGEGDFPPIQSLYRTNLPVPQTAFVGRAGEVRAVAELVVRPDTRLVTLTGPGGTGKTRLALQAAAEAADAFPDGVTWIALAPLRDPGLVLPAVAGALGIGDDGGRSPAEAVAAALAGKDALLLLDNAEHLMPGIADELAPLLEVAGPTLLATSREQLQLPAEHVVDVAPLEEPEGVELFLARARAAGAEIVSSETVAELCRRLDHLPLALELAAARTPLFSPEQLLARIGQRLDLLRGGRGLDARQQTLRATIEWSHDLLSEGEQRLFRRLAVFVGGCTFEAAEEICGADPDALQSLLAKSLVRRRDGPTGPRFWMLETILEFAAERLASADEAADVEARHARWYADLAVANHLALREQEEAGIRFFEAELPNARAALAWALEARDVVVAGDVLFALWYGWLTAGHGREASEAAAGWLALDRAALAPLERVPGLLGAGEIVRFTGDSSSAEALKSELADICRAHLDVSVHDWPLERMLAAVVTDLSTTEMDQGRLDEAEQHALEGLRLRRELGAPHGVAHALQAVASVAHARRDFGRCRELLGEAEAAWREAGRAIEAAQAQTGVAECHVLLGDPESAARLLAAALDVLARSRDEMNRAFAAHVAAMVAGAYGEHETAARLLGAVEGLEEKWGTVARSRYEVEIGAEFFGPVAEACGRDAFERARVSGRELDEQAMFELAVDVAKRCAHG